MFSTLLKERDNPRACRSASSCSMNSSIDLQSQVADHLLVLLGCLSPGSQIVTDQGNIGASSEHKRLQRAQRFFPPPENADILAGKDKTIGRDQAQNLPRSNWGVMLAG